MFIQWNVKELFSMIAQLITFGQFFEAAMLVCFGISWPIDIVKSLRSRRTEGKSLLFMVVIMVGYCFGIVAKFAESARTGDALPLVTILYALNLLFVAIDIVLYLRFRGAAVIKHK